MTGRGPHAAAAAAAAAWFLHIGSPLVAQTVGTVDIGASVVEYDGFLVSGAAVLSPALNFNASNFSAGVQGAWTIFESGNQIFQGTAAAAWLTPASRWWRAELSGSLGASKYADEPGYGHFLARLRLHLFSGRTGGWLGGTSGGSFGESDRTPFELEIGAWTVRDRVTLIGTVTSTWLGGDGYVDLIGAARWTSTLAVIEARAGARPWAEGGGGVGEARTDVYGDASVRVSMNDRIALQFSGGTYPSDPVRRVLGAKYATAGIRFNVFASRATAVPVITGAVIRAESDRLPAGGSGAARLEIASYGQPRTLRIHVRDARSVEIMGDFTDWQAVRLTQIDGTIWEVELVVSMGVHRVNVRIDGGEWLAPADTRMEETEFGGVVGVIVVP